MAKAKKNEAKKEKKERESIAQRMKGGPSASDSSKSSSGKEEK